MGRTMVLENTRFLFPSFLHYKPPLCFLPSCAASSLISVCLPPSLPGPFNILAKHSSVLGLRSRYSPLRCLGTRAVCVSALALCVPAGLP